MPRPPQITHEILSQHIRVRGPVSATELAAMLAVNRTTIARTLQDFGDELVTIGAARSTRYLLRRSIRGVGSQWPIYRMEANGRATAWAQAEALHENAWRIEWTAQTPEWAALFTDRHGLWPCLPFFLQEIRPQGFLGRIVASRLSRPLQLPDDPRRWKDDDTLVFLQSQGDDLPGNLVLGDEPLRLALANSADLFGENVVPAHQRAEAYLTNAQEIAETLPSSSAGGEQPKFLTTLADADGGFRPVLVKFTAPLDQSAALRWGDLLVCEFHANQVLAQAGLAIRGAELLDAGRRRFLQTTRFDRQGAGGRVGVISLESLTNSLLGTYPRAWTDAAPDLLDAGLIHEDGAARIALLQSFGDLIGNTDMHPGNLSFFLTNSLPLAVTPAYDMLPMLWAPGAQGEITPRRFTPAPPIPAMEEPWRQAAAMAENFWAAVSADEQLTPDFSRIAAESLATIRRLRDYVG